MKKVKADVIRNYLSVLVVMIVLMNIFYNSFYFAYEGFSKRKFVMWAIIVFGIVVVPILSVLIKPLRRLVTRIIEKVRSFFKKMYYNWQKLLLFCAVLVAVIVISAVVGKLSGNVNIGHMVFGVLFIVQCILFFKNTFAVKPELLFLVTALTVGSVLIGVSPARLGVSWDDQIHYERTLNLSNYLNGIIYDADIQIISDCYMSEDRMYAYQQDSREAYYEKLNNIYDTRGTRIYSFSETDIWSVAYIPSAIGIVLGRGLHMSFVHIFMMGRFFNLLAYSIIIYFAIKKLRYAKVLAATVGLLPTSLFMACCYSYDSWVIAFCMLGYAHFTYELQNMERKVSAKNMVLSVLFIVIGCMPKAVYFPLLFPLLFMPAKKFESKKQRIMYYVYIVLAALFLVASFIIPTITSTSALTDIRGDEGVDSGKQISYIIHNPLTYAKVLFSFLADFLSLDATGGYTQFFAYMGMGKYVVLATVIVIVVAFLDRNANRYKTGIVRIATFIGAFGAIILCATALYISFTKVGGTTVKGCSPRYILPIVFPVLYAVGSDGVSNKFNRKMFVSIPILIMAATFMINIYELCVKLY